MLLFSILFLITKNEELINVHFKLNSGLLYTSVLIWWHCIFCFLCMLYEFSAQNCSASDNTQTSLEII